MNVLFWIAWQEKPSSTGNRGADRHFVASTSIGQDSCVFWTSTPKSTGVLVCYELLGSFVDPVTRVLFRLLDVTGDSSLHRLV
jgi:hypothetical protein